MVKISFHRKINDEINIHKKKIIDLDAGQNFNQTIQIKIIFLTHILLVYRSFGHK